MAKSNYRSWQISHRQIPAGVDDSQKLKLFARYAVLAPSGHNTQPWKIRINDGVLELLADYSRRLPHSGVQANEPLVSLGSFLGVLELAAAGFGYKLLISYSSSAASRDKAKGVVATVKLASQTGADQKLLPAITNRVSNRNFYDKKPLPKALLSKITANPFDSVYFKTLESAEDIAFIADQTVNATRNVFSDQEFRVELSKWVRNNATRQYDGMPGFVQGIPTVPSLLAKHVIKRINVSKDQAKKDSKRILESPCLVLIGVKNLDGASLIDAGRLFSMICVRAQRENVATTGSGAAIIDPATREVVSKRYNLPGRPVAILRLGYATKKAKHAPRWPLEKILVD